MVRSDQRLNIVPLQADCVAFGGAARSFGADRIAKPLFFPNKPAKGNETKVIEVPGDRCCIVIDWRNYHVRIWVQSLKLCRTKETLDQNTRICLQIGLDALARSDLREEFP